MDIKEKNKDNESARMDLIENCRRPSLHLRQLPNGKFEKPKASFTLSRDQRHDLCVWIEGLMMPDGYASNLARCVDKTKLKLHGLKSHDCHVFMQRLLPIAFSALPQNVWKPLTELINSLETCVARSYVKKICYNWRKIFQLFSASWSAFFPQDFLIRWSTCPYTYPTRH